MKSTLTIPAAMARRDVRVRLLADPIGGKGSITTLVLVVPLGPDGLLDDRLGSDELERAKGQALRRETTWREVHPSKTPDRWASLPPAEVAGLILAWTGGRHRLHHGATRVNGAARAAFHVLVDLLELILPEPQGAPGGHPLARNAGARDSQEGRLTSDAGPHCPEPEPATGRTTSPRPLCHGSGSS